MAPDLATGCLPRGKKYPIACILSQKSELRMRSILEKTYHFTPHSKCGVCRLEGGVEILSSSPSLNIHITYTSSYIFSRSSCRDAYIYIYISTPKILISRGFFLNKKSQPRNPWPLASVRENDREASSLICWLRYFNNNNDYDHHWQWC